MLCLCIYGCYLRCRTFQQIASQYIVVYEWSSNEPIDVIRIWSPILRSLLASGIYVV